MTAVRSEAPPRTAPPAPAPRRLMTRSAALAVIITGVLTTGLLVSAATGAYPIPVAEILPSVANRLNAAAHWLGVGRAADAVGLRGAPVPGTGESVLWDIRMPRLVLAAIIGACLACAGTLMQGMFGNPLAEPGIIGVSLGAAVGAVAAIALGLSFAGNWTIPLCAFIAGFATVWTVYIVSRSGGRTEVVTLVLTGVAVNALAGACIGLLIFIADDAQISEITFWQLGSLAQTTWPKVLAVVPLAAAGLIVAPFYARRLDLLALGERPARHLGVDVERLRIVLIVVVALLTAAAVAVSGVIGFIGLVVPHLLRMAAGPGHRALIPLAALGGAAVLVWADLAARTLAAPAEMPLGVLTALVGSPFFFWLLRRTRRRQGGWA